MKRTMGLLCLFLAMSKLAFSQSHSASYGLNIQMDPDCDAYSGKLFCVVASEHSTDTLVLTNEPLIFKDSLPVLRVSVYTKPNDSTPFYLLVVFDSLVSDTSYILPVASSTQQNNHFLEKKGGVIFLKPLLINSILALEAKPRLQLHWVKLECKPQSGPIGCVVALCHGPIFDTQVWSSISVLDLRVQGQWLLPGD